MQNRNKLNLIMKESYKEKLQAYIRSQLISELTGIT